MRHKKRFINFALCTLVAFFGLILSSCDDGGNRQMSSRTNQGRIKEYEEFNQQIDKAMQDRNINELTNLGGRVRKGEFSIEEYRRLQGK
ncbi:MAG: hypothetical protein GY797_22950 [Deltaproteobacteria bacterium]|nr:hypothetical protein [Deltaproteobacteria bacterium]